MSRLMSLGLVGFALLASACTTTKPEEKDAKPANASLSRTLDMVDKDGRHYGTVELDPLGGGKVIDSDGRVVGTIVPPVTK